MSLPYRSRRRANSASAAVAASVFPSRWRPRAWAASVGVTDASRAKPLATRRPHGAHVDAGADDCVSSLWFGGQRLEKADIGPGQAAAHLAGSPPHEDPVELAGAVAVALTLERALHQLGVIEGESADRGDPARPEEEIGADRTIPQRDLAVTPDPMGVHEHRVDHRLVPADGGAVRAHLGPAIADHRDVRCGAPDVADDGVLGLGEVGRAQQRCRRSGQDRLDGALGDERRRNEAAVAPHDHHRGLDAAFLEHRLRGTDELADHRDETSVQQRGDAPPRTVQVGRELMAAGDRAIGLGQDSIADLDLVARVAHAELRRHGEGIDVRGGVEDRRHDLVGVERVSLVAVGGVTTRRQDQLVVVERCPETGTVHRVLVEADEDQAGPAPLVLDECVRRERGRQRDQADRIGTEARVRERAVDRTADPDREIVVGGRCLCRAEHLAIGVGVHHSVGVGPARVDAEYVGHRRKCATGQPGFRTWPSRLSRLLDHRVAGSNGAGLDDLGVDASEVETVVLVAVHEAVGLEAEPTGELRAAGVWLIGDLDHGTADRQLGAGRHVLGRDVEVDVELVTREGPPILGLGHELRGAAVHDVQLHVRVRTTVVGATAASLVPVVAGHTFLEVQLGLVEHLTLVLGRTTQHHLEGPVVLRGLQHVGESGLQLFGGEMLHAPSVTYRARLSEDILEARGDL